MQFFSNSSDTSLYWKLICFKQQNLLIIWSLVDSDYSKYLNANLPQEINPTPQVIKEFPVMNSHAMISIDFSFSRL